jgi:alpha-1,3-glucosyltransferase
MLKDWFRGLEKSKSSTSFALFLTVLLIILVKWSISLNGYSGLNTPPKYGDFEAQRHWLVKDINKGIDKRTTHQ